MFIQCCNHKVKIGNLTFLKDNKNFTGRKMFAFRCPYCNQYQAWISEKRIDDNKVFINVLKGKAAINFAARENNAKRIVQTLPNFYSKSLKGWLYGVNVQIKNRKGEVIKIRQYSCDMATGEKTLEKVVSCK